jgi:hypothetical protein
MIPASHFVHVIQAERQRDLERWQLTRDARSGDRLPADPVQPSGRRALLDPRRWLVRPAATILTTSDRVATPAPCC